MQYVTKDELTEACQGINDKIDDIKDNHLKSIYSLISVVSGKVNDLKWFVVGVGVVLALVLTILQVFGG